MYRNGISSYSIDSKGLQVGEKLVTLFRADDKKVKNVLFRSVPRLESYREVC